MVQPYRDGIKDVRWTVFEQSSHLPHVEETAAYLATVGPFLAAFD